jgi:hypothetical protein
MRLHLSATSRYRSGRNDVLDIFFLVLVRDLNVTPIGLQVDGDGFTKPLVIGGKGQLEDAVDVVFAEIRQFALISLIASTFTYSVQVKLR